MKNVAYARFALWQNSVAAKTMPLFLWLLLLACASPALAETLAKPTIPAANTTELKLAIIDVPRILQESLAAKSVQKQLETKRAQFQTAISEQEKTLHEDDNALKEARNTNSGSNFDEREQELRQRFLVMERDVQTKRHALDDGFNAAMAVVRDAVLTIVQEIAKARAVQAVLVKQQALWYEPSLDITDEVLRHLNHKLADVPVKVDFMATHDNNQKAVAVPQK
jgi:outer membrane protein